MSKYFLPSLKGYKRGYLKNDVIAGIIVAALTVPVAMGYAQVAGLPPVYGLYASIFPVLGYALFASSPQLIYGMDASASAITGSMLGMMGIAAASPEAIAMAPVLSFFTAVFLLVFAVLKLGRFATYISFPVMSGFISGISISIIVGQVPKVMGLEAHGTDFFPNLESIFGTILQTNLISLLLGVVTILIVLLAKRFLPKVPMALLLLVGMTALSGALMLDQYGVGITGEIPQGLPPVGIPDFAATPNFGVAVLGGLVTAIVIFADSLLDTNSFALQGGYKINDNQELRSFSFSNFAASLTGSSPTSASVSRTAASIGFHGKTQVVSIVAAGVVALVVMFLSGLLYYMPQPVLSGIIIAALIPVIDFGVMKMLFRRSRAEFVIWMVSALGVLLIGALAGVIIGVMLSFIDVIIRIATPPQAYLGVREGKDGFYDLSRYKDAKPAGDGIVIYRFTAALIFANIQIFKKGIVKAVAMNPKVIIVEASGINALDITAAQGVQEVIEQMEKEGIKFYFAGEIYSVNAALKNYGLNDFVESGHTQKTVGDAIKAATEEKTPVAKTTDATQQNA